MSLDNSPIIHRSDADSVAGVSKITSNEDRNLPMFHSFDKKFFAVVILCSEQRKSYPKLLSAAAQNLKTSAPYLWIRGRGSITFPLLLLIFSPFSSRPYPIIQASDHGNRLVSWKQRNIV